MSANLPIEWADKKNSPLLADFIAKYGAEYCMTAEEINQLRNAVNEMAVIQQSTFLGAAEPASMPAGTGNRYWSAIVPGTYTNYGGVVVNENSLAFISVTAAGVFSISQTALDLTGYYSIKNGIIISDKNNCLSFDTINKTLTYPSSLYVSVGNKNIYPYSLTTETIDVPDVLSYVLFKISTGRFICKSIIESDVDTALRDIDLIMCGTVWMTIKHVQLNGAIFKKDGTLNEGLNKIRRGILQTSKINPIKFDFLNNQIVLNEGCYIILPDDSTYPFINPITIPIPSVLSYILYDPLTNSLSTLSILDDVSILQGDKYVILGTVWKTTKTVNLNNGVYFETSESKELIFTDTTQRLILPPKMYFIEGEELPIYKNNIVTEKDIALLNKITTVVISNQNKANRYNGFSYNAILKASELESTFKIGMRTSMQPDCNYYKEIQKASVTALSASGKTIKILSFGDSLTAGGVPSKLATALTNRGIVVSQVGTFADINGIYAEGKGGWSYRQIVGKDNNMSNQPIYLTPNGSALSDQMSNPFLKLATAIDKSNNPTWCFRNTGSQLELSYQSDTVKTGDFYIFDFGWYITSRGLQVPDVITIAYGTNDVGMDNLSLTDLINHVRLSLEIMVKQIKAAYPNIIIGIVPNPNWSSSLLGDDRNINYGSILIENIMTDIKTYQSTYSNLSIIPVWCHLNKDWNWMYPTGVYADTITNISSINDSKRVTRAEYIHFNNDGYDEYIRAMEAWVLNVI